MDMPKIERVLTKDAGRSWREGNMFLAEEFMTIYVRTRSAVMSMVDQYVLGKIYTTL